MHNPNGKIRDDLMSQVMKCATGLSRPPNNTTPLPREQSLSTRTLDFPKKSIPFSCKILIIGFIAEPNASRAIPSCQLAPPSIWG